MDKPSKPAFAAQIVFDILDVNGKSIHQIDGGVAVRARVWGGKEFPPVPMTGQGRAAFDAACKQARAEIRAAGRGVRVGE